MFQKNYRIKKKKDFEIIFKKGKSFKNNLFILKFINNDLGYNRFGFVVSQKVSKKATVRNKVRRRLVEVVKKEEKKINLLEREITGRDLVVVALPSIDNKEFSEIKESLEAALIKILFH